MLVKEEIHPHPLFISETLRKCENILTIRKQQDLKYKEIYLPETINDKDGFHLDCYRRFTAVSKAQKDKYNEVLNRECSVANNSRLTRSSSVTMTKKESRIFSKICLFCNRVDKKHQQQKQQKQKLVRYEIQVDKYRRKQETLTWEIPTGMLLNLYSKGIFMRYAEILKDNEMLAKVSCVDFLAREVHYHNIC